MIDKYIGMCSIYSYIAVNSMYISELRSNYQRFNELFRSLRNSERFEAISREHRAEHVWFGLQGGLA
jgi:hypothetical protein